MPEIANCPCCGNALKERVSIDSLTLVHECQMWGCCFRCNDTMVGKIAASMELARVTFWDCTDLARDRAMSAYREAFK